MTKKFTQSESLLERATKSIPLGSQTFSKSRTQYPFGVSPYFIQRGEGCRVWDVDGNEYIDMVSSLAAVTLGYNDPDVTLAVTDQLKEGVIFSLPHPIEMEVAEKIIEMVPCADRVRFGKNGSDATAGAVRLARAYTGRDLVAACGYHGWQDWYIGSTLRNLGVPQAVRDLTFTFPYNDLSALKALLEAHTGKFAAVILEPMNIFYPEKGYLEGVQALAREHGAVLIFDETITGFRFANGGAQELFGVTPDLACFGKGLANGFPLSALAGKAEIMKLMEDIFFSFTFGGETLSLAAANATLHKLQTQPILETMAARGKVLYQSLESLIRTHGLEEFATLGGAPVWSFVIFKDSPESSQWEKKTYFMQEMFQRGILTLGSHNLNYAHTEKDLSQLLVAYDQVFALMAPELKAGKSLQGKLKCETLMPLFRVR